MKISTANISSRRLRQLRTMLTAMLMVSIAAFSQPSLVAPVDAALNISTGPTLSWTAVGGATVYQLQVSLVSNFSTTVYNNASITGTSQLVTGLANGTEYFWHVSDNNTGLGTFSATQSFTINPTPVNLGTAADFRVFANTGITGGAGSAITGDIGVASAASSLTGFSEAMDGGGTFSTSDFVTGNIYAFDYADPTPTKMTTAASDMGTAYTNAANRTPVPVGTYLNAGNGAGEIGGLDLGPGLYKWNTAVTISNDLTLTGNSTDVWIFQCASTLGMADGKQIILVGGALSSNIFWQVAGQVTFVGTAAIKGNILGQTGIAFGANGTMDGRALAQANVTLITNALLPVELVSFTASAHQKNVNLTWSTATEVNNFGFAVERKTNNNWNKVGFVDGAGTTNSPKNYSFIDNNLSAGKYSYRLKQIDRAGTFEYSQLVEVSIGQTVNKFALLQNYPNPFNPSTIIQYSIVNAGMVSLKVYDLLGKEVATLVNSNQEAGRYTVSFNANTGITNLSSGIYFYRLQSGSVVSTKKFILMK